MPRPVGTIGETKFKILAIIHHHREQGVMSYGYNIWRMMKKKFYLYMDPEELRNVYHHLKELNILGLVERGTYHSVQGAPNRQLYLLTEKGRGLKSRFDKYLDVLT